jgi:hypothetical protein
MRDRTVSALQQEQKNTDLVDTGAIFLKQEQRK